MILRRLIILILKEKVPAGIPKVMVPVGRLYRRFQLNFEIYALELGSHKFKHPLKKTLAAVLLILKHMITLPMQPAFSGKCHFALKA